MMHCKTEEEDIFKIPKEVKKAFEIFPSLQRLFHDNRQLTHIFSPFTAYSVFVYEDGFYEELKKLADTFITGLHSGSLKDCMKSVSFHIKHSVSYIWIPADKSSFSVSLNSYKRADLYGMEEGYHIVSADKEYYKGIKLVFFYNGGVYIERNIKRLEKLTPFTINDLAKVRLFYGDKGYRIVVKLLEDVMTGNAFKDILCQMEKRFLFKFPPLSLNEINGKHSLEEVMLAKYAGKELIKKIKFNKTDLAVGYMIYKTYNRVNEGSRAILLDAKNHTDMLFQIHDRYYDGKIWYNDEQDFLADVLYIHILQYEGEPYSDFDMISIHDYVATCKRTKDKVNLRFRSYKKFMEAHDEESIKYQNIFVPEIAISANSGFMKLRTMLPEKEFEWITTKRRIIAEGNSMHHCVATYADKINKDKCAIYSYAEPKTGKRYTIEFGKFRGEENRYRIAQIRGVCNASCPAEIKKYIESFL